MYFLNRRFLVGSMSLCLLSGLTTATTSAKPLYETSFESEKVGPLKSAAGSGVQWSAKGGEITNSHAKSGKQSLHIQGGKDQWAKLTISGQSSKAKGISFWAERWSSKGSFSLKVEAVVDGKRTELTKLDNMIEVGARFRSHVVLALPEGSDVSEIKMTLTSANGKGMLLDDVALLTEKPKTVTEAPVILPMPTERLKLLADTQVFIAGEDNTHTYRIPSIITAMNGDLIAACDARRDTSGDLVHFNARNIDIVVKRSTDNGKTWGHGGDRYKEMSQLIALAYCRAAVKSGAEIAPVGLAWFKAMQKDKRLELHLPDKSHPTVKGSYLAACVFYATLTGRSPVGLPEKLNTSEGRVICRLTRSDARWLQQVAQNTVSSFQGRDAAKKLIAAHEKTLQRWENFKGKLHKGVTPEAAQKAYGKPHAASNNNGKVIQVYRLVGDRELWLIYNKERKLETASFQPQTGDIELPEAP